MISNGKEEESFGPITHMDVIMHELDTSINEHDALIDLSVLDKLWEDINPNLRLPTREIISVLANKCGISTELHKESPMHAFVNYISSEARNKLDRQKN